MAVPRLFAFAASACWEGVTAACPMAVTTRSVLKRARRVDDKNTWRRILLRLQWRKNPFSTIEHGARLGNAGWHAGLIQFGCVAKRANSFDAVQQQPPC